MEAGSGLGSLPGSPQSDTRLSDEVAKDCLLVMEGLVSEIEKAFDLNTPDRTGAPWESRGSPLKLREHFDARPYIQEYPVRPVIYWVEPHAQLKHTLSTTPTAPADRIRSLQVKKLLSPLAKRGATSETRIAPLYPQDTGRAPEFILDSLVPRTRSHTDNSLASQPSTIIALGPFKALKLRDKVGGNGMGRAREKKSVTAYDECIMVK